MDKRELRPLIFDDGELPKEYWKMADEQKSDVEDIKIRLGDDIPFEDETVYKTQQEEPDLVGDFRDLGQQFADTLRSAWYSEERKQFESEMREGLHSFATEVDKAVKEIIASDPAQKAKAEAEEIKTKAAEGDIAQKTRSGLSQGLRRFSEEMARWSDSFTTTEKEPPAEEDEG